MRYKTYLRDLAKLDRKLTENERIVISRAADYIERLEYDAKIMD